MLKGTKYGQVRDYYWEQTRNAEEAIIRAVKAEVAKKLLDAGVSQALLDDVHIRGYLESCGADSVVNACANLLGPDLPGVKELPRIFPNWPRGPQLDDVTMLCFSDPANEAAMRAVLSWFRGADVMENRYMPLHSVVAWMMFGIRAEWKENRTYDEVFAAVEAGNSVGMLLPSHYVSSGIVDDETGDLRIKDSWGNRKPEWKGDGFLQPLTRSEFSTVKQTVMYFKPKEGGSV